MQFVVPKFKLGQVIEGTVEEINRDDSLIVNFAGDLLRVVNRSGMRVSVGSSVSLVVTGIQPLKFQLQPTSHFAQANHINRQA